MANLIGRFYFKQTKSGNLIGEFSNNNSISDINGNVNEAESANIKGALEAKFIGTYNSCWGDIRETTAAELIITHKFTSNNNIYTLLWKNEKGTEIFWGEGFIVDDILIGDYRNFPNIALISFQSTPPEKP